MINPVYDFRFNSLMDSFADSPFASVCIVNGILSAGRPTILLERDEEKGSEFTLAERIFKFCIARCSEPGAIFQDFQMLRTLTMRLQGMMGFSNIFIYYSNSKYINLQLVNYQIADFQ